MIVSVIMVRLIGLPGIYVGTVVQGLFCTVIKPYILYRDVFDQNPVHYYIDSVKFLAGELLAAIVLYVLKYWIIGSIANVTVLNFGIMILLTAVIPNVLFYVLFRHTEEWNYLSNLVGNRLIGKLRRKAK